MYKHAKINRNLEIHEELSESETDQKTEQSVVKENNVDVSSNIEISSDEETVPDKHEKSISDLDKHENEDLHPYIYLTAQQIFILLWQRDALPSVPRGLNPMLIL